MVCQRTSDRPDGSTRYITRDGQTLRINDVLVSDTGRYTCVAKNAAGMAERDFELEVVSKYCSSVINTVLTLLVRVLSAIIRVYTCGTRLTWTPVHVPVWYLCYLSVYIHISTYFFIVHLYVPCLHVMVVEVYDL